MMAYSGTQHGATDISRTLVGGTYEQCTLILYFRKVLMNDFIAPA